MKKRGFISPLSVILFITCVLSGGFYEYISCVLSVILGIYIVVKIRNQNHIKIKKNLTSAAIVSICIGYGLSCFWAIDSGMAWIGFCKFAPLALYMVALWQSEEREQLRQVLPLFGAITVPISVIGMHMPFFENYFSVSDRLAGFFQYPNTYALFLLVCELLFITQPPAKKWHYFIPLILIAGLLYTGSRTVFVLFLVSNIGVLMLRGKKAIWVALALSAIAMLFLAITMLWGKDTVLYRYLDISLAESTFVGRVLYAVDALPLLLKYPFGMGYMGYYYVQSGVQSGLYSVVYAHNDLLQVFLDVGVIPGTLFLAAIVAYFRKKGIEPKNKLIVGTVLIHCLLDFNLQFVFIFLLLIYLMDDPEEKIFKTKSTPVKAAAIAVAAISLYMAIPLFSAHMGADELASALYPYNTQHQIKLLEKEQDIIAANKLSQSILSRNKTSYIPYSIQSKYAYAKGDFANVIKNKRAALEKAPFCYQEYEEYCMMLINGIKAYSKKGDTASIKVCQQELCAVARLLADTESRMSSLGKRIDDQPRFHLPEEIQAYIDQVIREEQFAP